MTVLGGETKQEKAAVRDPKMIPISTHLIPALNDALTIISNKTATAPQKHEQLKATISKMMEGFTFLKPDRVDKDLQLQAILALLSPRVSLGSATWTKLMEYAVVELPCGKQKVKTVWKDFTQIYTQRLVLEGDALTYLLLLCVTLDYRVVQFYLARPAKFTEVRSIQNAFTSLVLADKNTAASSASGEEFSTWVNTSLKARLEDRVIAKYEGVTDAKENKRKRRQKKEEPEPQQFPPEVLREMMICI